MKVPSSKSSSKRHAPRVKCSAHPHVKVRDGRTKRMKTKLMKRKQRMRTTMRIYWHAAHWEEYVVLLSLKHVGSLVQYLYLSCPKLLIFIQFYLKFLLAINLRYLDWFVQMEDDTSPVLAPKQKDAPKEEPSYNNPLKQASSGSAQGTPTTSKSKGKRKTNGDDVKATTNKVAPPKKAKTENEVKPSKEEIALTSKSSVRCMLTKVAAPSSSKTTSTASSSNA